MTDRNMWQRTKSGSKGTFDKLWGYADKLGEPVNKLSNKLGAEAFWPTTLDKESEKAARILRSFSKDGFYQEEFRQSIDGPKQKQKVIKHIPHEVVKNAKGLAIFTTMRTGLWMSGAGGSGVLVGRQDDGSWSQPVGIMLHTAGLGFLVGVDIYDCVLVLNTEQALNAFSRWRCTIGGELSAVAGPAGLGGVLDTEVHRRQAPIFTYLKSRGFYAGVQIDGTVVIERTDEDERFYGQKISAKDILAGKAQSGKWEIRMLMETLKAAQGDKSIKSSLLPAEPPPADYDIAEEGHVFGVPDREDPDPFGVLALEKEGLQIKEASTKMRASSEQFDFKPIMTSPVFETFRRSTDSGRPGPGSPRSSWRRSNLSSTTERERTYATSDVSTQTDFDSPYVTSPKTGKPFTDSPSVRSAKSNEEGSPKLVNPADRHVDGLGISVAESREESRPLSEVRENDLGEAVENQATAGHQENDTARIEMISPIISPPQRALDGQLELESPVSPPSRTSSLGKLNALPAPDEQDEHDEHDDGKNHGENDVPEDIVVHEVRQAPQVITKARMVNVPRRIPPKLPERNPGRTGRSSVARAVQVNGASGPPSESDATSMRSVSIKSEEIGTASAGSADKSSTKDNETPSSMNGTVNSSDRSHADVKSPEAHPGKPTLAISGTAQSFTSTAKADSSPNEASTTSDEYITSSTEPLDIQHAPTAETDSLHTTLLNHTSVSTHTTTTDSNPNIPSSSAMASPISSLTQTYPTISSSTNNEAAPHINGAADHTANHSTVQDAPTSSISHQSSPSPPLSPPPRNQNRSTTPILGAPTANGTVTPVKDPSPRTESPPQISTVTNSADPPSSKALEHTLDRSPNTTIGGSHEGPRISLANIRGGLDTDDEDDDPRSRSRSRSRGASPLRVE